MPEPLKQDEINELTKMLAGEGAARGGAPPSPPPAPPAAAEPPPPAPVPAPPPLAEPLEPSAPAAAPPVQAGMDLLADVNVHVTVELGRTKSPVQDILKMGPGSVVPLDRLTGEPLDVYVNDRLVARGEVLVVNDNFAVRITEVLPPSKGQDS